MILNSEMIKKLINENDMISNFIELDTQLQPNGFDLTLNIFTLRKIDRANILHVDFDNVKRKLPDYQKIIPNSLDSENKYSEYNVRLGTGAYVFKFNEYVKLPSNVMAECKPRSTLLRGFCDVRNAYWDRGFHGLSEGLLLVYEPVILYDKARIAQMKFTMLEDDGKIYDGIYKS